MPRVPPTVEDPGLGPQGGAGQNFAPSSARRAVAATLLGGVLYFLAPALPRAVALMAGLLAADVLVLGTNGRGFINGLSTSLSQPEPLTVASGAPSSGASTPGAGAGVQGPCKPGWEFRSAAVGSLPGYNWVCYNPKTGAIEELGIHSSPGP